LDAALTPSTRDGKPEKLELTFLGAFGLQDPVRPKAWSCIRYAGGERLENPQAPPQINIRMVTGDHIETARAVALSVGILGDEEAGQDSVVMEGKALWDAVGGPRGTGKGFGDSFVKAANPADEEAGRPSNDDPTPVDLEAFERIAGSLKVLARATPAEKRLFVAGLKALPQDPLKTLAEDRAATAAGAGEAARREVACTGAHQRDAQTLKEATVGFAMGYGCTAAREACDVILTDGDLEAALRAVMWGRNVYNNVSRFIQF
jgi:magnesium-transporting ATPase (P-type)